MTVTTTQFGRFFFLIRICQKRKLTKRTFDIWFTIHRIAEVGQNSARIHSSSFDFLSLLFASEWMNAWDFACERSTIFNVLLHQIFSSFTLSKYISVYFLRLFFIMLRNFDCEKVIVFNFHLKFFVRLANTTFSPWMFYECQEKRKEYMYIPSVASSVMLYHCVDRWKTIQFFCQFFIEIAFDWSREFQISFWFLFNNRHFSILMHLKERNEYIPRFKWLWNVNGLDHGHFVDVRKRSSTYQTTIDFDG